MTREVKPVASSGLCTGCELRKNTKLHLASGRVFPHETNGFEHKNQQ